MIVFSWIKLLADVLSYITIPLIFLDWFTYVKYHYKMYNHDLNIAKRDEFKSTSASFGKISKLKLIWQILKSKGSLENIRIEANGFTYDTHGCRVY